MAKSGKGAVQGAVQSAVQTAAKSGKIAVQGAVQTAVVKTIIVTDNHLEHQCFQIVQSLTLEPPSGEFPSTHRRIPVRYI